MRDLRAHIGYVHPDMEQLWILQSNVIAKRGAIRASFFSLVQDEGSGQDGPTPRGGSSLDTSSNPNVPTKASIVSIAPERERERERGGDVFSSSLLPATTIPNTTPVSFLHVIKNAKIAVKNDIVALMAWLKETGR
ncbi:hypothetical protein JHK85_012600 [Glycine max]|nr:hypothetical protein JHK87_012159 [Glycine soja]KAG5040124.1 hypothetical protein JHK85_012600 [Glycine max]KAG5057266.1 hypothetical protein JHK86_012262 [Glycine max]